MKIALVGQPNCGKSTIFNWIAGYKSATANFPGTTVRYTASKARLNGKIAELIDLPRVAFLMDALMHRIGLHGTSIFPTILGYGCSVPAVMATRILRSPRDRFLAAMLAVMVPCSARTAVILGLVAFYLGANTALAIYLINRKELSLLMLMQALSTTNIAAAMTPAQIMIFTMFVVFYIPCLATITVLWREIGKGRTVMIAAITLVLAIVVGVMTRMLFTAGGVW